jgi:hypothetical protein
MTDNWFPPNLPLVPQDYWRSPVICTLLVDLMSQTNKVDYTTTLDNARKAGECCFTWCGFYDDLTWWGRLFMHCYHYFESHSDSARAKLFLNDALIVCDQLDQAWKAWDKPEYCNGGVWWKRPTRWDPPIPPANFKASNSTFGFMETALTLYLVLGDKKYLDFGQMAWDWIVKYKYIDDKGLVWGALTAECTIDPDNVPVLSLQGEALAPLWYLYKATNKTEYLDMADKIAEGTIATMVWEGTHIMQDRDDATWAGHDDDWKRKTENSGDTPFKGLFATYLGEYAKNISALSDRQQKVAKYAAFLRANADAVWINYPGHMFSMDWHTLDAAYQPIPDADETNASMQYSGVGALAAAALVS